jgi:hypothetical protein
MSNVEYFYKKDEEIIGPLSHAEILSLVKNGTLDRSTQVMRGDVKIWISAYDIPDLPRDPKDYFMMPPPDEDGARPQEKAETIEQAFSRAGRYLFYISASWSVLLLSTVIIGYLHVRGAFVHRGYFDLKEFLTIAQIPSALLLLLLIIARPEKSVFFFTFIPPAVFYTWLFWVRNSNPMRPLSISLFYIFFTILSALLAGFFLSYKTRKSIVIITALVMLALLISTFL